MLPRPEGLPFTRPAKKLAMIYARARTRYREDMPVLAKPIGAKVRELIDEHDHIKKHVAEDPVHFQKLSERLEKILEESGQNWEQLSVALKPFVEEVRAGRKVDDTTGVSPIEAPFFDLLNHEIEHDHTMSGREQQQLVG